MIRLYGIVDEINDAILDTAPAIALPAACVAFCAALAAVLAV